MNTITIIEASTETVQAKMKMTYEILDPRLDELEFKQATEGSAGFDLRAVLDEPLTLQPNEVKLIGTGIKIQMPYTNMAAMILPRSGLGHKDGIVLGNLVGLIDSDYTGELKISCWNRSSVSYTVNPMDRIAQLIFVPVFHIDMVKGKVSDNASRGDKGFNSTGTK